ncbi:cytochrome b5 [Obba rivulosa]|uniref:Cytochrome b5 n=1 Tax=Obba rivulosa TaxID=1052685 RepID=A0A8E2DLG8_9APHY|nr:cytochrome b5 [Obba rivulosa]
MAFDLGTPINTALLLYILYTAQRILFPSNKVPEAIPTEFKNGYSWMPKSHPPTLLFQTYTPKTLEPFNGQEGKRILLAIKGVVYDVTAGRNFYGPNGMYANFAGRDASRGMAKQSFDTEMLTPIDQPLDKLDDLTSEEIENMKGKWSSTSPLCRLTGLPRTGWMDHFQNKYIVCGRLVENDAA